MMKEIEEALAAGKTFEEFLKEREAKLREEFEQAAKAKIERETKEKQQEQPRKDLVKALIKWSIAQGYLEQDDIDISEEVEKEIKKIEEQNALKANCFNELDKFMKMLI